MSQVVYNCTYKLSRKMTAGGEDTISVDGVETKKFGIGIDTKPMFQTNWSRDASQIPTLGTAYSEVISGYGKNEAITVNFNILNSVPFKLMTGYENKGHGSYVANTTHVFAPMPVTIGRLQRVILIKEVGSNTYVYHGCFADALNLKFSTSDHKLRAYMEFFPYTRTKNTATPSNRYFAKTSGGTEVQGELVNLHSVTWNSNAWSGIEDIDIGFSRGARLTHVDADGKHYYVEPRNVDVMFTVNTCVLATGQADDIENDTIRDLYVKFTKADVTKTVEIYLYNCTISNPQPDEDIEKPIMYSILGYAEDYLIVVTDGVADTELDETAEA